MRQKKVPLMRKHIIYIVTLTLIQLFSMALPVSAQEPKSIYYSRWPRLSSKQLIALGDSLRSVRHQPDSALACFSLVANRYYEKTSLSREDQRCVVEALLSISSLWLDSFKDYPKAMSYALQAQIVAKKYGLDYYQPSVNVMLATIESYKPVIDGDYRLRTDVLNLYKKAFNQALELKNWNALKLASLDLLMETAFKKKTKLISNELQKLRTMQLPQSLGWPKMMRRIIAGLDVWEGKYESGEWKRLNQVQQRQLADSAVAIFHGVLDDIAQIDSSERSMITVFVQFLIAMAYEDSGQNEKLIGELKAVEEYALKNNMTEALADAYMNEWVYYTKHGPKELAQEYRIKLLEARISMIDNDGLGQVANVKLAYEIQMKNEEVRELALKRQMDQRVLACVIASSLLFLVFLILLLHKYRQLKQKNRLLYERMNQLLRAEDDFVNLSGTSKRVITEAPKEPDSPAEKAETEEETAEEKQKYGKNILASEEQSDLLHRVIIVMETSSEIYSEDFTLERLARLANGKRNTVSQVINERYKTNFNGMLNEYRIKEACRRMNDNKNYGNYTIEAIAQSVGFKSRSNFGSVFKRITGLTPSVYKQMADEKQAEGSEK